MEDKTRNALLLGAGFLMGTVGIKALTSPRAKRVYVQGVAKGLQAKAYYEDVRRRCRGGGEGAGLAWSSPCKRSSPAVCG